METDERYRTIKVRKIKPAKFVKLLTDKQPFVLDVRPANFARNRQFVSGSHHIPLLDLADRQHTLPGDRPILITDWAGKQSPLASKFLERHGYNIVGILKGGVERWAVENYPLESRQLSGSTGDLGNGGDFK